MSFTLSANVTAGKGGGSVPLYLLELDSLSTTYRFGTFGTGSVGGWSGNEFTGGRIAENGLGDITYECDVKFGGNVSSAGTFSFKLINTDLWALTAVNGGEIFENCRVELRLIFSDKTAPSWANAAPRFFGYVDNWYWDESFVYFSCKARSIKEKQLPSRLLTKVDWANLPDENEGAAIPLLYGDFSMGNGVNRSGLASNFAPGDDDIIHRDYFRGVLVEPIQRAGANGTNNPRAVFCAHDATVTLAPLTDDIKKYTYDKNRNIWVHAGISYQDVDSFGSYISGCTTRSVVSGELAAAGWKKKYLRLIPIANDPDSTGVANIDNAVDEDDSNYTTLDTNGDIASYQIPAKYGKGDDTTTTTIYVAYRIDAVNRVNDVCHIQILNGAGSEVYAYTAAASYDSLNEILATFAYDAAGDYTGITINFKYVQVSGSDDAGCEFRIRTVFLRIDEFNDEIPSAHIYDTGKGRMYDGWIDEAPHTCTYDEDDLIENPAFTVESILDNELAVDISERLVYEAGNASHGFDRIGLQRDLWKLARQVLNQESSRELIRQIAYEFGFAFFERRDGKACVARIDPLGDPAVITNADVLSRGNKSSLSIKRVNAQDMKNEFVLHYRENYSSGDFDDMIYVKSPNESVYSVTYTNLDSNGEDYWDICHAAYNDYAVVNKWEFEAKWIRTKATAEMFLKMMIKKLTRRPYIVEFDSSLNLCNLELMDIRRIVHRLVPTAPSRSADGFEDGYRFDYDKVIDDTLAGGTHYRCIKQVESPVDKTIRHTFLDVGLYEALTPDYSIPSYDADGNVTYISPTLILDADDLVSTVNDGDKVASWTDKSANAFVFTEATKPPAFTMGLFGGHAGIEFDGDSYLESSSAVLSDVIQGGESTVFIVCEIDAIGTDSATISSNEAIICDKTSANFGVFLRSTPRANFMNKDSGGEDSVYITVKTESPTLLTCVHDSSDALKMIQEKGDDEISSSGTSGATASLTNKIILGANADKGQGFDGKIGFMLIYNVALTDAQQALVCDCLRTKYSIY